MSVRIEDIPSTDRPRERLKRLGLASLSDAELVALVIRSGMIGSSALETASRLIADRGGTKQLSQAQLEEIAKTAGIGTAKAASLLAAFELGRRASLTEDHFGLVRTPEQLANLAGRYLSDPKHEQVVVVILGPGNRLIRVVPVSAGAAEFCIIPIREILAAVLRNDGVAFALVHNHPSGELRPSEEDVRLTRSVAEAAVCAGLRFLDHLIVSNSLWLSLVQCGFLEAHESWETKEHE